MAGVGNKVVTTDYNNMQTTISSVLGKGSTNYGYGQAIQSSQVSLSSKITATQWANLRNDILRARQHQTGTDISASVPLVPTGQKITESDRAAYQQVVTDAETNRLAFPPATNATRENLVPNQTASGWRTLLTQPITMTFAAGSNASYSWTAADAARFYFNAGAKIEISATLTGPFSAASNLKATTWQTMFTQMGTITFSANTTTVSGSGTAAAIGFFQLTTVDQLIFTKLAPAGTYSANKYYIYARKSADGSQVILTVQFRDDYAPGGWGIDEYVDGTLTSIVQTYHATGSNVTLPLPSTTGPLSGT